MKLTKITSDRVGECYYTFVHSSGLKVYVYPREGFNSAYAVLGTKYGSVNAAFSIDGGNTVVDVLPGTAHFLEHKMFENEEGDAFSFYSQTGASANAYTSFNKTCYLFSCTENFERSLEILLSFVQMPYFTDKTVSKEQGIIGQEIQMYDDDPEWKMMVNLLQAMYVRHPVRVDIAGSVESIAQITPESLHACYDAFYEPHNMVLCIAGNVDPQATMNLVEKLVKPSNNQHTELVKIFPDEPYEVRDRVIEQRFPVLSPMFEFGFKGKGVQEHTIAEIVCSEILLYMISSKASPLYRMLLDAGLINIASFNAQYFYGPGYGAMIFSGESRDPYAVADIIRGEITRLKSDGLSEELFNMAKNTLYGSVLSMLNSTEEIANTIVELEFSGKELFDNIEYIANVKFADVQGQFAQHLDTNNTSLSVILPLEEKDNV